MTIDEETDRDLEMEDRSGDDMDNGPITIDTSLPYLSTSFNINIVSPLDDDDDQYAQSVKSTPANFENRTKSRNLPPIVSPTNADVGNILSDDDDDAGSISTVARNARKARIKNLLEKNRNRPQRKLSDILRLDSSVDVSYGSDEGSC